MKLPEKKYAVIYADPPWSYRQHGTGPKSRGNAAQHYHTMTVEDICALPVRQLAGGGAGMRAVHVGDIPNHPRCAEGYGRMGLYISHFCSLTQVKFQKEAWVWEKRRQRSLRGKIF